jgi:Glycosyl transferase 4-like domain
MNNRWLIISYFANIDPMAPSHHIDDRLPLISQRGIDIRLLTSPCGARHRRFGHVRVPSSMPSGIRYEVRHLLRRKTRSKAWCKFWEIVLLLPVYPFYFLEKAFFRLDSTWSWFITASMAAVVLSLKDRPEIIYSTGGPVSAHMAAMTASRLLKVPHIAEFQDPLVHEYAAPGKRERYFMKVVERSLFKTASALVFLTRQAASNAVSRHPHGGKAITIYAGAAPLESVMPYKKGEKFTVAHFGSLGGSRALDHLLSALDVLFRIDPALPGYFRLALYGNSTRPVKRSIELFPRGDTIVSYGKVRRAEAVESMQSADLLLLIQNTDDVSFETIPSKVYEYLQTGRPILALVYRNQELQDMLEDLGHIVVQADDVAAIQEGLMTYIGRWKLDLLQSSVAQSPYTVENAVSRLIEVASGSAAGEKK